MPALRQEAVDRHGTCDENDRDRESDPGAGKRGVTARRWIRGHLAMPGTSAHPWDGYRSGPENELAMAAAQAIARGDRQGISPMVVHGPSGVGKSRLLAGLVAERLQAGAGLGRGAPGRRDVRRGVCRGGRGASGDGWAALRDRLRGVDLFISKTWRAWSAPRRPARSWRTRSMRSRPPGPASRSRRGPRPGRGRDASGRPGWSIACWGA